MLRHIPRSGASGPMEKIINIFQSLGVDESFFVQFAVVVILYFLLKVLLFEKLQYVLELRENKTTKREDGANKQLNEAEDMALKYKESMNKIQQEAHQLIVRKRTEAEEKQKNEIKLKSKELEKKLEKLRVQYTAEIDSKKDDVLAQADQLAGQLVEKLTK